MSFTFRPAEFRCDTLMFGLAGPSSSGKTKSALRLATGLSPDKPIFVIDTERGRSLLYAREYKFSVLEMDPPFSPARYQEAIEAAVNAGAGAVIVDSMSHEHEGIGGILEMHEAELDRMAGKDWSKRERMKFSAWIKPKAEHNRLVNRVLQLRAHMIFCFRAKDKLVLVQNDRGKQEPVSAGLTPICTDRFEYEMTGMLILPPGAQGRPDLSAKPTKLNDDLARIFRDGEQLTEAHGTALREWANGGREEKQSRAPAAAPKKSLREIIREKLDACTTADEVADVQNLPPHIRKALDGAAPEIRQEIDEMFQDAFARVNGEVRAET